MVFKRKIQIGLKRGMVKLVKYTPQWKRSFQREEKKIKKIFGRDALSIHHVGSTSIRGILAKPIIDIVLTVPSLKRAKGYIKKLKQIDYEIKKGDIKKVRLFFTKGPERKRTHYLHIGEIGSGYSEDMILFRDYLRMHESTAESYSELKEKLSRKFQNMREVYTTKKEQFIKATVRKAKKSTRML